MVIAPIRQGQRPTRRSALQVDLSRELPRSAPARGAACRALMVRSSSVYGRALAFLIGDRQRGGGANGRVMTGLGCRRGMYGNVALVAQSDRGHATVL